MAPNKRPRRGQAAVREIINPIPAQEPVQAGGQARDMAQYVQAINERIEQLEARRDQAEEEGARRIDAVVARFQPPQQQNDENQEDVWGPIEKAVSTVVKDYPKSPVEGKALSARFIVKQAEVFNEVRKLLLKGKVKPALEAIDKRLAELKLADQIPGSLDILDKMQAVQGVTKDADMVKAIIELSKNKSPKPKPAQGSLKRRYANPQPQPLLGPQQFYPQGPICNACFGRGHYANSCPSVYGGGFGYQPRVRSYPSIQHPQPLIPK